MGTLQTFQRRQPVVAKASRRTIGAIIRTKGEFSQSDMLDIDKNRRVEVGRRVSDTLQTAAGILVSIFD